MQQIEIDKTRYPFKLSFGVLTRIGKLTGHKTLASIDKAFADMPIDKIPDVIKWCIDAGASISGEEVSITVGEIRDALEQDFSILQQFSELCANDMGAMSGEQKSDGKGN